MDNFTIDDVINYYTSLFQDRKIDKRERLVGNIRDKMSKISNKNAKLLGLKSDINTLTLEIEQIENEIQQLPSNKQHKLEGKLSKVETKKAKSLDKQSRVDELANLIIPEIYQDIAHIQSEIANLDKTYNARLEDQISNFGNHQASVINNKWFKLPYGTSVSMVGLNYYFYYLGQEIEVVEVSKQDCNDLHVTNVINSSPDLIQSSSVINNINVDGGIYIGDIYK